jgi:hypothetical protein
MNAPLLPRDRDRLVSCLRLGGCVTAPLPERAGATRIIEASGLTWDDVVVVSVPDPAAEPKDTYRSDTYSYTYAEADDDPIGLDWCATAAVCRRYTHMLNTWEPGFVTGLTRFPRLSTKRRATLALIVERLRTYGVTI